MHLCVVCFVARLVDWFWGWYNIVSSCSAGVGFGLVGFACRFHLYAAGLGFL